MVGDGRCGVGEEESKEERGGSAQEHEKAEELSGSCLDSGTQILALPHRISCGVLGKLLDFFLH